MQVRIPDSPHADALRVLAFNRRTTVPSLTTLAIEEFLERNRAELKHGPKLDQFSTSKKRRTEKR